jgi:hypothetical protein
VAWEAKLISGVAGRSKLLGHDPNGERYFGPVDLVEHIICDLVRMLPSMRASASWWPSKDTSMIVSRRLDRPTQ